ncbi:MAG: hypothetical protein P8K08_10545 [Fuerstiella sp.]|jgi:hypothetical protein|nr:hypothetical protein [Fuerstiella sp.]
MADTRYGLWQLNMEHQTLPRTHNQISRIKFPTMLIVALLSAGHESHALLYREPNGDEFELWQPTGGYFIMTDQQITTFRHGHGVKCVITSSPNRNAGTSLTAFQGHP